MSRWGSMVCLGLLALGAAGCSSLREGSGLLGEARVDEINLLTMPMALNLDQIPGADGFAVKIYAIDKDRPKSVAITSGRLEIISYDGIVTPASMSTNKPNSKWEFSAADLAVYAQETSVGVVYALTPTWQDRQPQREQITISACYYPPERQKNQRRICSRPTTVTVSLPAKF